MWFQNRRAKFRRNERSSTSNRSLLSQSPGQPVPVLTHNPHKASIDKSHFPTSSPMDGLAIAPPPPPHFTSLGFTSLGVFSTAAAVAAANSTKTPNFNYGNSYNPYHSVSSAENPYLGNYCQTNYNNFPSFRYKPQTVQPSAAHGYPSI